MGGVIVDLDRRAQRERSQPHDGFALGALVFGCVAFALLVLIMRPATVLTSAPSGIGASFSADLPVPRGVVLHPLQLPAQYANVELGAMPDRVANEAPPSSLRDVITVRGIPGVASADGPAMIAWTEHGIAYRLTSATRSTSDLIAIANALQ